MKQNHDIYLKVKKGVYKMYVLCSASLE